MTEQQRCQKAATAPACLEMPVALMFTAEHVDTIRAAGAAYRHLFELRAIGPEWAPAYAEWQRLAEAVAVVVLRKLEDLESRMNKLPEDCPMESATVTENAINPHGKVRASAVQHSTENALNPHGKVRASAVQHSTENALNPHGKVRASAVQHSTENALNPHGKVRTASTNSAAVALGELNK